MPRTLAETSVVTWKNAGPRISAAYDVLGDGKTAIKGSAARYYYVIPTTGTPLDSVNPGTRPSLADLTVGTTRNPRS